MQLIRDRCARGRGFSLVEMAVVVAILGLLLVTAMYTLSAQQQQRAREETQRRLEQAREAILGFAVANGRLPCPAGATGVESMTTPGAGDCTSHVGLLPAATIGFQPVDSSGFGLDAWNNRLRYAVAQNIADCSGTSTTPHFTSKVNLKANGMSCRPSDNQLLICKSTQSTPAPAVGSCGPADNVVTNQGTVVVVIYSTGPNFATATGARPDEDENTDADTLFIHHTPQPDGALGGEYDDMMIWIPVGTLYGRLANAGLLP
jgi:prepilin-type N-terminal cleavage/methylation domain-containing protein